MSSKERPLALSVEVSDRYSADDYMDHFVLLANGHALVNERTQSSYADLDDAETWAIGKLKTLFGNQS